MGGDKIRWTWNKRNLFSREDKDSGGPTPGRRRGTTKRPHPQAQSARRLPESDDEDSKDGQKAPKRILTVSGNTQSKALRPRQ